MDSKVSGFYNAFYDFSRENIVEKSDAILPFFKTVLKIDFDAFTNCWEFFLVKHEKLLSKPEFNKIFTYDILNIACEKNYQKTVKSILGVPVISKALYFFSEYSATGNAFEILESLLLTQKVTDAEVLMKHLQKNTTVKTGFGENMVQLVEKLFFDILKKQGNVSKKVELPRKLRTLLTDYIAKIKGPERALLEQRIREIS